MGAKSTFEKHAHEEEEKEERREREKEKEKEEILSLTGSHERFQIATFAGYVVRSLLFFCGWDARVFTAG
jgi:hypothetical protein